MAITKTKFGEYDGRSVYAYTLLGKGGLSAEILTYGGIIRKLIYKGTDVVLGRDALDEYLNDKAFYGALIGRNANRIQNATFSLGDKTYTLTRNDGTSNLHGGTNGFYTKIWDAEIVNEETPSLLLSLTSPDGDEGFPGTAQIRVLYTLTDDNGLEIRYEGSCDEDTVMNLTNHAYFNMNGHDSGTIENHSLFVHSDYYTPTHDDRTLKGEILSVKNTPFDFFSDSATIGERHRSEHPQIKKFGGFDHNLVLRGRGYREVAAFTGDKTGITMKIFTDQSCLQFYSGSMIDTNGAHKDGHVYGRYSGVCLETQGFPGAPTFSHFPSSFLKKGDLYKTVTTYQFI